MIKRASLIFTALLFTLLCTAQISTTTNPDGTFTNTYHNGNTSTTIHPDGTFSNTHHNGNTSTTINPDGTFSNTYHNGNTSTTVNSDGTPSTNMSNTNTQKNTAPLNSTFNRLNQAGKGKNESQNSKCRR